MHSPAPLGSDCLTLPVFLSPSVCTIGFYINRMFCNVTQKSQLGSPVCFHNSRLAGCDGVSLREGLEELDFDLI